MRVRVRGRGRGRVRVRVRVRVRARARANPIPNPDPNPNPNPSQVAKAHAASDRAGTARIARTSVAFGGVAGLVLAAATLLSAPALSRAYCGGNAALLAPLCARYVLGLGVGLGCSPSP